MILTLALLLAAPDKLPPAAALPPPASEEAAVLAPVNALFAAIAARDGAGMAAQSTGTGTVTVATEKPEGTTITHRSWAELAAGMKPGPERYEERLTSPAVEIDGDIAMVWGSYVFLIDGKPHHCGVDHFDLVRKDGAWKLVNATWSWRATGCAD